MDYQIHLQLALMSQCSSPVTGRLLQLHPPGDANLPLLPAIFDSPQIPTLPAPCELGHGAGTQESPTGDQENPSAALGTGGHGLNSPKD